MVGEVGGIMLEKKQKTPPFEFFFLLFFEFGGGYPSSSLATGPSEGHAWLLRRSCIFVSIFGVLLGSAHTVHTHLATSSTMVAGKAGTRHPQRIGRQV